jgi:hypothetical protein
VHGVCVAEKGVFRFRLTTDGVAGHASIPSMGDNALLKIAPLLQRMAAGQPSHDLTEGPRALLEGLGVTLDELRERDPALALMVEPMLGVTLTPTRRRSTSSPRAPSCRSTAGCPRASARTSRGGGSRRCWAATATGSSSPST